MSDCCAVVRNEKDRMTNRDLQKARAAKNDEFYTPYEAIEQELSHYKRHFKDKTVLCNCDNPHKSNFCKYFLRNFNVLKLRRLVCTSISISKILDFRQLSEEDVRALDLCPRGYVLDVHEFCVGCEGVISEACVNQYLERAGVVRKLKGDGDFRSPECMAYFKIADIIVTNPPFSLFKVMMAQISKFKKGFLLIGNQNALTYKEVFPLIQKNEAWIGYRFGEMKFRVPQWSEPHKTRYWVDCEGQKWRSLGNAMWLTNLDITRRHKKLILREKYEEGKYPKYDLFDAIDVRAVADIPSDYPGVMGVPITFVNRYNGEQFEIVGEANHGSDNEYDLFMPTINGKQIFKRLLIRHKMETEKRTCRFRILDLFCGAGGFSYGMEQNQHFETKVALDFNRAALATFKHNMPLAKTIEGDITDSEVKKKIIRLSRRNQVNMVIGGPPCQGFSLKGKKLGLNDPRNFLFNEYLNVVEEIQPEVFVIENVKALLSTSAGWFKSQIVERVRRMGYFVEYGVLTASDFGVPQARQRAIFICSRNTAIPLPKPTGNASPTVKDAIYDLAYLDSGEGAFEQTYITTPTSDYQRAMRKGSARLYNHKASKHAEIAIRKLMMIPPECGKEHLPAQLTGKQVFSGTWGRLKWDSVSPTIDTRFDAASNGTNNHPFLHRAITPREAARLQSFDDKFVFIGKKVQIRQQIGNAVPPLLAKAIADQIDDVLANKRGMQNER